jgi:hypothetical protein
MNKGGRPKDTLDRLPDGWEKGCEELASQGASEVELRVYLGLHEGLFYRFLKDEPKFSQTIKTCADLCRVWWEKNGRVNLDTKEFNSTLWYMNMKNRFGWADKQEQKVDHTTKGDKIQSISPHSFVGED